MWPTVQDLIFINGDASVYRRFEDTLFYFTLWCWFCVSSCLRLFATIHSSVGDVSIATHKMENMTE